VHARADAVRCFLGLGDLPKGCQSREKVGATENVPCAPPEVASVSDIDYWRRVAASKQQVCTIGYSGRALEDFLGVLKKARIEVVVDVRALPLSRRKGFSKTSLRTALESAGIDYRHVRAAGNPFRAQKSNTKRCLALYSAHLDRTPDALDEVEELVKAKRCALLCFEAVACECHRSIIADRLRRTSPRLVVTDL
jgi:hypothetical protein